MKAIVLVNDKDSQINVRILRNQNVITLGPKEKSDPLRVSMLVKQWAPVLNSLGISHESATIEKSDEPKEVEPQEAAINTESNSVEEVVTASDNIKENEPKVESTKVEKPAEVPAKTTRAKRKTVKK